MYTVIQVGSEFHFFLTLFDSFSKPFILKVWNIVYVHWNDRLWNRRRVYNIVDDDPAPREEVFEYASDLVEKKWPGWIKQPSEQKESSELTVKKRGFRGEKRVSNARMKKELGVRLLHPSYRSGLQSLIDQMDSPFQHGKLNSWVAEADLSNHRTVFPLVLNIFRWKNDFRTTFFSLTICWKILDL